MDSIVILAITVIALAVGWWCVRWFMRMTWLLVKIGGFAALAFVAAQLTMANAEFPSEPSENARKLVHAIEKKFSQQLAELPSLNVDFDWAKTAQADEQPKSAKIESFRF